MIHELEEQREMATNRMTELEKLTKDHQEALMQIEQLKMDVCIYLINKILYLRDFNKVSVVKWYKANIYISKYIVHLTVKD